MPWARLDDRFHDNRKVRRVWSECPAALSLHILALTYSAGHLLDGAVDPLFVAERVPVRRHREQFVAALVDAGLWKITGDGWEINDYLVFNPSRAEVEAKRAKAAATGRLGGLAKARANGSANA